MIIFCNEDIQKIYISDGEKNILKRLQDLILFSVYILFLEKVIFIVFSRKVVIEVFG